MSCCHRSNPAPPTDSPTGRMNPCRRLRLLHDLGLQSADLRWHGRKEYASKRGRLPRRTSQSQAPLDAIELARVRPTKRRPICVYVCDRFVVPALSVDQQAQIADGQLALNKLTREVIRDRYAYRFATTSDGLAAFALEREIQRGALGAGKPFLNPLH